MDYDPLAIRLLFTWLQEVFGFLSLGGLPFNVLQSCCMECALGRGCGLVQSIETRVNMLLVQLLPSPITIGS